MMRNRTGWWLLVLFLTTALLSTSNARTLRAIDDEPAADEDSAVTLPPNPDDEGESTASAPDENAPPAEEAPVAANEDSPTESPDDEAAAQVDNPMEGPDDGAPADGGAQVDNGPEPQVNEATTAPNDELQELYRCHGMEPDECERQRQKLAALRQQVSIITGQSVLREDQMVKDEFAERLDGCIILTEPQLDVILSNLDALFPAPGAPSRRKRNLVNFQSAPQQRWTMPIKYRFEGSQSEGQRVIIRGAFQHWMDNTCVRFSEVPSFEQLTEPHILLTNEPYSCYSYVGKVQLATPYQQLNLGDSCLYRFGTPVHEIGHSLGLWHEQMRADRDEAIRVLWDNIVPNYVGQFYSQFQTVNLGVPYDYSSVMQYSSLDGVSANGKDTMEALNPLYQMNMGQRTGLSFNDIRLINLAYCQDTCKQKVPRPCEHGGYQNPNDCSRCHCPDGFAGDYCEKSAPARNSQCGGEITVAPNSVQKIFSPGYDGGHYQSYQECTWWFKAPQGYRLTLNFEGEFGLYCQYSACYHWVEVKYKSALGLEGARFCCYERPKVNVTSELNEMMVVFKSNFSVDYYTAQRGFAAVLIPEKVIKKNAAVPQPDKMMWECSFEPESKPDQLCGMVQDSSDDFDWTVYSGPTPSNPTGPDAAFDGQYYVYIEASNPRKLDDKARLILPTLESQTGPACVEFYYHMFGFHINTLKLIEQNGQSQRDLWVHRGQISNMWLKQSVNVSLNPNAKLLFEAWRGEEFSGDIGLDKIKVMVGSCVMV
jgi:astacin